MRKSVVVPAFFPSSISSEKALIDAMACVAAEAPSVDTLEFYFEGGYSPPIGDALRRLGKRSIFLAAVKTKRDGLDLAATNGDARREAVKEGERCIDAGLAYGSEAVLINTGFAPGAAADSTRAMGALAASLEMLLGYAERGGGGRPIDLFMETGAMNRSSRELIGSTRTARDLAARIRGAHAGFFLTMDTSHLLQLGEDPLAAIEAASPFTRHVHLANCVIRDPSSPLYGDMHPEFGSEGSELSEERAAELYRKIQGILPFPGTLFGVEIICRQPDERRFFEAVARKLEWFLGNGKGNGG
jgi:sugar phosphate isomerase/epimerase